jgi:hypothetical protein
VDHSARAGHATAHRSAAPEDAVQHAAIVNSRNAAWLVGQQRLDHAALEIGQIISAHATMNQTLKPLGRWDRINRMNALQQRLMTVERTTLLVMLARLIHDLTIHSRYFYDREDAFDGMRETNEAIHRIAGHMRALIDPTELITASRAGSIAAASELLSPAALDRLYGFTA